jgi:D-arabinose 1-dehydrogenase-like Zn-dependent alcohol dehydrogenase
VSVEQKFARSLGVFSLALGAVQLVAPRRFAKAIGVTPSRERPGVVRLVGARDVQVENVPDPKILNDRDAIVKITSTAICGSDLHLYDGYIPTMKKGDILGHEFMGEVVESARA